MKKIISLVMSLIMIFGICSIGVNAAIYEINMTKYPVIAVAGYTASQFYRIDEETGEKIHVWGDPAAAIGDAAGGSVSKIIVEALEYLALGNVDPIAKRLGEGFNRIFSDMRCNPDGTSVYPVYMYVHEPAETTYAYLREAYPEGTHQVENEIMSVVCDKIGAENCYIFTNDFRMGAVENAESLREYIDAVIEHHNEGKAEEDKVDRVNIFSLSHGSQVAGVYATLYGHEGKLNNLVLTIPALGGAGIAYDAFNAHNKTPSFDDVGIIEFVQHAFLLEEDYQYIVEAGLLGFLDELVGALIPYCMETIQYWGSLWDFIPLEYYDELKSQHLDPELNAGLIAKSDFMHYEIMSEDGEHYYAKGFSKAQQAGANIYILAGYDVLVLSGMEVTSDALIPTEGATGATCAPYGKRFADGYVQKVDTGFYQVSPSMTVDASTSYLPEHTWFIEQYYHGMTYKDEYTRDLMYTLLLNDESYDVHSFPEYPQFHATTNLSHSVHAMFDTSKEGYVSSEDTSLVIKNISGENNILITAITVNGIDDISFDVAPFALKPGESRAVAYKGTLPEVSLKNFEINVSYVIETYTPIGQRTFDFTIMNGEAVEFDSENPLVDADCTQKIDEVLEDDVTSIFEKYGIKSIVSTVFDVVYKIIGYVRAIVERFSGKTVI